MNIIRATLSDLGRMLGVGDHVEATLKEDGAARAMLTRRGLFKAGAAFAAGACVFGVKLEPVEWVMTMITWKASAFANIGQFPSGIHPKQDSTGRAIIDFVNGQVSGPWRVLPKKQYDDEQSELMRSVLDEFRAGRTF